MFFVCDVKFFLWIKQKRRVKKWIKKIKHKANVVWNSKSHWVQLTEFTVDKITDARLTWSFFWYFSLQFCYSYFNSSFSIYFTVRIKRKSEKKIKQKFARFFDTENMSTAILHHSRILCNILHSPCILYSKLNFSTFVGFQLF